MNKHRKIYSKLVSEGLAQAHPDYSFVLPLSAAHVPEISIKIVPPTRWKRQFFYFSWLPEVRRLVAVVLFMPLQGVDTRPMRNLMWHVPLLRSCTVHVVQLGYQCVNISIKTSVYICTAAAQWTSPPTKTCEALMHISVNDYNCTSNEECDTLHCSFNGYPTNLTFTLMFLPCNHPPAGRLTFFLSGSVIFDRVFSGAQTTPLEILGTQLSVRVEYLPKDVIGIQVSTL